MPIGGLTTCCGMLASDTVLGLDIGTTSCKAVLVDANGAALATASLDTSAYADGSGSASSTTAVAGYEVRAPAAGPTCHRLRAGASGGGERVAAEQHVERVLRAAQEVVRRVAAAAPEAIARLGRVAVTGQMHGVVLWSDFAAGEPLHGGGGGGPAGAGLGGDRAASRDGAVSAARATAPPRVDCSRLVTWEDKRCSPDDLARWNSAGSPLSSGFGVATLTWYAERARSPACCGAAAACDSHGMLDRYAHAGTIVDFVVCLLTGTPVPVMDPVNAAAWGAFSLLDGAWDAARLELLQVPRGLLPRVVPSGTLAGKTCEAAAAAFAIPVGVDVAVGTGDHPCGVFASLASKHDAALNVGTSAQLAVPLGSDAALQALRAHANVPGAPFPRTEVRPYYHGGFLAVVAPRTGGNALAALVHCVRCWMQELGIKVDGDGGKVDRMLHGRLEQIAQDRARGGAGGSTSQFSGGLRVRPTFFGERYEPTVSGSITGITESNLSLGNLYAGACEGVLRELYDGLAPGLLEAAGTQRLVASGGAATRSATLRAAAERLFGMPVHVTTHADAALGAARLHIPVHRHSHTEGRPVGGRQSADGCEWRRATLLWGAGVMVMLASSAR